MGIKIDKMIQTDDIREIDNNVNSREIYNNINEHNMSSITHIVPFELFRETVLNDNFDFFFDIIIIFGYINVIATL